MTGAGEPGGADTGGAGDGHGAGDDGGAGDGHGAGDGGAAGDDGGAGDGHGAGDDDGADEVSARRERGPIAWFVNNSVAANVLMLVFLVGGLVSAGNVKQEVFPEFELDMIVVSVPYPGASPEEVESGVVLAVEDAVQGVENVAEVRSTASEGSGTTVVDLHTGADASRALEEVKQAVDRITSFPEDTERPAVFKADNRNDVISVAVYGDEPDTTLRALAEGVRDDLLDHDRISEVELSAVRPLEISIEVPREELRRHGLTIPEIAGAARRASIDLPGGSVDTRGGEVLLRTTERRELGREFEDVVVRADAGGSALRLGAIADIDDGLADTDRSATFDGEPAAMVRVFRTGDQTPLEIAEAVHEYIEERRADLPPGVALAPWFDRAEFYEDRIDLLLRNAYVGLALVVIVLGLFLQVRLAFWVTLGIVVAFVGSFLLLPATGASINMISLFAFLLVLGMVVDDAIVVGESVYRRRREGMGRRRAAIYGAREMAVPVIFAIATTIIAYAPMLFVPGPAGNFFVVIPIVVMAVLALSLIEALLILPAHLAHSRTERPAGIFGWIARRQEGFSRGLERFIDRRYAPALRAAVGRRYLTLAIGLAVLIGTVGLFAGGRLQTEFIPRIESELVIASAELPHGAAVDSTEALRDQLVADAREALAELGGDEEAHVRGIFAQVGGSTFGGGGDPGGTRGGGGRGHQAEVALYTVTADERPFDSAELGQAWRARSEHFPGLESLDMTYATGPGAGAPISFELRHRDLDVLEAAAGDLASALAGYGGVHDIEDGVRRGAPQLDLTLDPAARTLGLTEADLARQVRGAFFGEEAVRQPRGREEVRAYVRLPEDERASEHDIERFMVRTPGGGEIPLLEAARVERGRAYTSIRRIDGRRALTVEADVDRAAANANEIVADASAEVLPELEERYPGLSWRPAGEQREQQRVNESLSRNGTIALVAIFAILAVAFRSYVQPAVIMLVIPFGLVGAMWGHVIMNGVGALVPGLAGDYAFSLMSVFGVLALAGVVINDSLILMVGVNRARARGLPLAESLVEGGSRRFRPIVLTSVTTFFGLSPMILETSVQAQFLVPMAISLGFGVVFATLITLFLVPAAYGATEDLRTAFARTRDALGPRAGSP